MHWPWLPVVVLLLVAADVIATEPHRPLLLERGQSLPLPGPPTVPVQANERAITAVELGHDGSVWAATSGTKAHLYAFDPATGTCRGHVAGLDVGVGLSHGLGMIRDGSVIWGTQRDITGLATEVDADWLGMLQQIWVGERTTNKPVGKPVAGQGIYTFTYLPASNELVGLTWPDGHFFSQGVANLTATDYGPIAGYRTYETPRYAEKINQGTGRKLQYARQVSRVIAIDPATGAYTAGEDGFVYRYDPQAKKLNKLDIRLPAAAGREPFASWDAAYVLPAGGDRKYASILGGTPDGY